MTRGLILGGFAAGLALGAGVTLFVSEVVVDGDDDAPPAAEVTATRTATPRPTRTPEPTSEPVILAPVIVREGPARLTAGTDALVIVGEDLLEQTVQEGLADADLPFELTNITAELEREGLRVRGDIGIEILGADLTGDFSALVQPYAEDGDLRVQISDVDAEGLDLPGAFNGTISGVVNDRLGQVVSLAGYEVVNAEVGDGELLVYLRQVP